MKQKENKHRRIAISAVIIGGIISIAVNLTAFYIQSTIPLNLLVLIFLIVASLVLSVFLLNNIDKLVSLIGFIRALIQRRPEKLNLTILIGFSVVMIITCLLAELAFPRIIETMLQNLVP
jgi:hypothetical protein